MVQHTMAPPNTQPEPSDITSFDSWIGPIEKVRIGLMDDFNQQGVGEFWAIDSAANPMNYMQAVWAQQPQVGAGSAW